MADETRSLAKFVTNFKLEDAPAPNRDRMHDLLVDQIGVEIGSRICRGRSRFTKPIAELVARRKQPC